MSFSYVAEAIASGDGRNGHVETSDGRVSVDLAIPHILGGTGAGSNPEQLVAMGFAACFLNSVRSAADARGIDLVNPEIICRVTLQGSGNGPSVLFQIIVSLSGLNPSIADDLTDAARLHCPYYKALANGADVDLQTIVNGIDPPASQG